MTKFDFYELHAIKVNYVGSMIFNDLEKRNILDIEQEWYNTYCYDKDFTKNLKIDTTYFILCENKIIGVFCPHLGFSFFDVAEHDDRIEIKRIFPNLKCNIIGEEYKGD